MNLPKTTWSKIRVKNNPLVTRPPPKICGGKIGVSHFLALFIIRTASKFTHTLLNGRGTLTSLGVTCFLICYWKKSDYVICDFVPGKFLAVFCVACPPFFLDIFSLLTFVFTASSTFHHLFSFCRFFVYK
jgi:hypothetical protein